MNPLAIALSLVGGLGGFLGGRGQKGLDPAALARLFGPDVLAGDTATLFNTLSASPAFQAIMNSASESGSLVGQRLRGNLARAGLGSSGTGALSGAVSRGFGQNLILGARGNLWNTALNAAQNNLAGRMSLFAGERARTAANPTMAQSFGNALTGAASTGLEALLARRAAAIPGANVATTPSGAYTPTTSVVTAPMRRVGGGQTVLESNPFDRRFRPSFAF
jgi:hypothetical protein